MKKTMFKITIAVLAMTLFFVGCSKQEAPKVGKSTGARTTPAWQNQTLAGFNSVAVFTPNSTTSTGKHSLLIVLHGCTQQNTAFQTANLEEAAEQYGMIVAAPDAMNKAGFQCWSFWEGVKSRTSDDYKRLIDLAKHYTENGQVDPNQVYIAGLSSGGTFAMTTACLAPDIFAGMSNLAGVPVGHSGDVFAHVVIPPHENAQRCTNLAEGYTSYFNSQIAVFGAGTNDTTVPREYAEDNAAMMAFIYGAQVSADNSKSFGSEKLWGINGSTAISKLTLAGLGHAWPGGDGASGSYIEASNFNFGTYLAEFFTKNNRRGIQYPCHIYFPLPISVSSFSGIIPVNVQVGYCKEIVKVALFVDNIKLAEDSTAPYSFAWDSNGVENGSHTVKVRAYFVDGTYKDYSAVLEIDNKKICHTEIAKGNAYQHYIAQRLDMSGYSTYLAKYGYIAEFTLYHLNSDNGESWGDVDALPEACYVEKPTIAMTSPAQGTTIPKNDSVTVVGTAKNTVKVIVQLKGASTGSLYTRNTITSTNPERIINFSTPLNTNVTWSGSYIIEIIAESADGLTVSHEIPVTIQ